MTTRTIVVAGGSSGIGLAVAQKAVADGWRTIIVDRQEPIELVDATFFHCDLLDNDSAHQVLDGIVRDQERIDALVISGGEPTLHRGLGDAIAATHRSGFPVGLHTCGYAPGRLDVLLEREETRPDWVGLDIKALPSDMPAVTGCSPRAATGSWQSLRLLADARDRLGLDLQVRTTIWPDSILERHLDAVRAAVADYGCELVVQYARGVNERGEYYADLF